MPTHPIATLLRRWRPAACLALVCLLIAACAPAATDPAAAGTSPALAVVAPAATEIDAPAATGTATARAAATATSTHTPTVTRTGTATHTATPTRTPTTTPTRTATPAPTRTTGPTPTPQPTQVSTPPDTATPLPSATQAPPAIGHPYDRPVVIANYFPWYDPETWSRGCTSAGDTPRDGVYNSDDDTVIQRHILQAQAAGIDGFAVHFFAPGNRTDVNLQKVLAYSGGGFRDTVTFLTHILPGQTQGTVRDSLNYLMEISGHPSFMRYNGKAVILFADMTRIPDDGGGRTADDNVALARWRAVRDAVDPGHNTIWIAEGLNPVYLDVFDGLYVYKIDHACCAGAYNSAPRWAGWVRSAEQASGQPKYWVGTVMPGWNDLNSANPGCEDLRVSSQPFARDRAGGAYYAATWSAVLPTAPDFVVVHSFNEWVEGSYMEPSAFYGDQYLGLTAAWAAQFRASR